MGFDVHDPYVESKPVIDEAPCILCGLPVRWHWYSSLRNAFLLHLAMYHPDRATMDAPDPHPETHHDSRTP